MSIHETDPLASAEPASTPSENEGTTAAAASNGWVIIEPGRSAIPRGHRNQTETDPEIGSARLAGLMPFALSQLGRPYTVWDLSTGNQVERTERLSLKEHVGELSAKLGCGADFIYDRVRHICETAPENVRVSSFLKKATKGGKCGCRLKDNKPELFWKAIDQVCVVDGLRPGREQAIKAIRAYLAANGWQGKLPTDKTLRKHSKSERIIRAKADSYERDHLFRVIQKPAESLGLMSLVQLDTTMFTSEETDVLRVVNDQGQDMGPANVIFGLLGSNRGIWTFQAFVGAANSYLAGLSIKRGLLSKEPLLREYGIAGVYPYSGKVGEIRHDNGSEFIAQHLQRVLKDLDMGFNESSPVGTPHYRGKEERFNRTAHKLFDAFLESEIGKRYLREVKGSPKAKGIRLVDLDRALLEWIVVDYHNRGHKGLGGDSPNSRFEKLAEGRDGLPASGLSTPLAPSDELDWDFMCEDYRVVNHLGISWENRAYRTPELQALFVVNKRSSLRRVPFRYNPYGLNAVFIKVPDGKGGEKIIRVPWVPELEKYPMTEEELRQATNPSKWEWDLIYSRLRQAGHAEPTSGVVEALFNKQEAEAESARKPGAPKRKDRITDNRNRGMRQLHGEENLPATTAKPEPPPEAKTKPAYRPVFLPVTGGHEDY